MTYHSDPTRWTQSPGEAPELLRSGLEAAGREGPSDLQMRALALKLAAVGTGAALAAGAAGAKASTTAAGAGLAATGSSVLTKLAVSVALIGAAATGGVMLLRQGEAPKAPVSVSAPSAPQAAIEQASSAPVQAAVVQPTVAQPTVVPAVEQLVAAPASVEASANEDRPATERASAAGPTTGEALRMEPARAERRERRQSLRSEEALEAQASQPAASNARAATPDFVQVKGEPTKLSEIDLLSKARSALAARPREAYQLTEQHKSVYPQGVFAQERDVLAVEALQRAGELKHARELAEAFVKRYPSSPAAHRFRETMNLP